MNRREALQALMALPALTSIKVAQLQPSDIIVLEYPGVLSTEVMDRLEASMVSIWPGRKVVVLDQGMTMKVVRG